jgi:hypothetical protein
MKAGFAKAQPIRRAGIPGDLDLVQRAEQI